MSDAETTSGDLTTYSILDIQKKILGLYVEKEDPLYESLNKILEESLVSRQKKKLGGKKTMKNKSYKR